jgi:uncharacterized protein YbjT (DUF2867 family)
MHIILGATGHIGSAVAEALLQQNEQVTVITRDNKKQSQWQDKGAQVAVVDVLRTKELRQVFCSGKRLFLLNPPADPATDTVAEEQKTLASILAALKDSGIEKVIAESTYGAQPGEGNGDLSVLYDMEQGLAEQRIPASIIRAAYYMSNWDASLQTALEEGKVHTFYPADFKLPMVAPNDVGQFAAQLMIEPVENTGLYYIEGPETYSSTDVATAFAKALQKEVYAETIPQKQWEQVLTGMGFSEKAAASMTAMTATTLDNRYTKPDAPITGTITLEEYISNLVQKNQ